MLLTTYSFDRGYDRGFRAQKPEVLGNPTEGTPLRMLRAATTLLIIDTPIFAGISWELWLNFPRLEEVRSVSIVFQTCANRFRRWSRRSCERKLGRNFKHSQASRVRFNLAGRHSTQLTGYFTSLPHLVSMGAAKIRLYLSLALHGPPIPAVIPIGTFIQLRDALRICRMF